MKPEAKKLFDLAWEMSQAQAEGLPKPIDERVADLEKRVDRLERGKDLLKDILNFD